MLLNSNIESDIHLIGHRLVRCAHQCDGIENDPENGILPRCLVLETDNRTDEQGCAIIGMNPGRASAQETKWHEIHGVTYGDVVDYWKAHVGDKNRYYFQLRKLSDQLGFTGPLLWTELAKCQSAAGVGIPPLQTFRTCSSEYLTEELRLCPEDWPLIAVGREAHKALSYLYPNRIVIGVPHPTGSWGNFSRLFDHSSQLFPRFSSMVDSALTSQTTVWLDT